MSDDAQLAELVARQQAQAQAVRDLKSTNTAELDKAGLEAALVLLEDCKQKVNARRAELGLPVAQTGGRQKKAKPKAKQAEKAKAEQSSSKGGKNTKSALVGITVKKSENFPEWYSQVVIKTELIDYYDISGCYILRPDSYEMWEHVKDFFDSRIKAMGVRNCCFPMFISEAALCKEADHVEGFAPEVAWVTKGGKSDLDKPIAVRPTSETAMYPAYSRWIRSHRDLPLKLNQWVSVVRWEFKSPTPFLRSREFLWQEGHTVFSNRKDAMTEVYDILNLYAATYEELLAVPVVRGTKTEEEKFPGGEVTTTVECYIAQNGRAIQAATSHCLGQNFAKMYDVTFENEQGERQLAWQNSWGLTTRSLGIMIMVHGDDQGLVLPPRVASKQVVIIPLFYKDKDNAAIEAKAQALGRKLAAAGIRTHVDLSEGHNPGFKYHFWEMRGVPIRIELGPRDLESSTVVAVRRDTGAKTAGIPMDGLAAKMRGMLEEIQTALFEKAKAARDEHIVRVTEWKDFVPQLNSRNIALVPWCKIQECELDIKKASGEEAADVIEAMDKATAAAADSGAENFVALSGAAKSLCMPFDQPALEEGQKCIRCDRKAETWCLFGRSY